MKPISNKRKAFLKFEKRRRARMTPWQLMCEGLSNFAKVMRESAATAEEFARVLEEVSKVGAGWHAHPTVIERGLEESWAYWNNWDSRHDYRA